MDTILEEADDLVIDEAFISEMEQFSDELNEEIDGILKRESFFSAQKNEENRSKLNDYVASDSVKALQIPEYILERYKNLEMYCNTSFVNPDDMRWFHYISRAIELHFQTSSNLPNAAEKALFRTLSLQSREQNLPSTLIDDLVSLMMEYIYAGSFTPVVFQGKPGCGKTETAKIIAKFLGLRYYQISCSAIGYGNGMFGTGAFYKSADCGELWKGILHTQVLNPFYIIDELDKTVRASDRIPVDEELLTVLNDEDRNVPDNFIGFPISLKRSPIIFTCNDIEKVSAPLRDRCRIFSFPDPRIDQLLSIINEYADSLVRDRYHGKMTIDKTGLEATVKLLLRSGMTSIRQHKKMVENACRFAYREYLRSEKDIPKVTFEMLKLSGSSLLQTNSKSIGF